MTLTLVRKLLRDLRVPLLVWMLFLGGFECPWYKVAQRFTAQLPPFFLGIAAAQKVSRQQLRDELFSGPSRVFQTLIGGESINFERAMDSLSIGYVHPLVMTLLCVWAI